MSIYHSEVWRLEDLEEVVVVFSGAHESHLVDNIEELNALTVEYVLLSYGHVLQDHNLLLQVIGPRNNPLLLVVLIFVNHLK